MATETQRLDALVLLHVGCANCYHEGFINTDKDYTVKGVTKTTKNRVDVLHDLGKPWPFESESVDGIVGMHVFQQLAPRELFLVAFPEAYRVLKKGGVLRMGVPCVDIEDKPLEYLLGWNNVTLLSKELLENVSHRIGFKKFRERGYRRSYLRPLRRVDNRPNRGTRYFEFVK